MTDPDHPGGSSQIKAAGLQRFLRAAQRMVGISGEVNVLVTSNLEMRRLNRNFRAKDQPTDVLSFPVAQNGRVKLAGDIAISQEIARSNANTLGHSLETEVKVLLLHGLLHLAGHDHEQDQGEMAALEQKLRAKLKLPTGLIERTREPVEPALNHVEKNKLASSSVSSVVNPAGRRRPARRTPCS